jgi:hypothetical protein
MSRFDDKKEPSDRFIFSIFGFGAGFISGMLFTLYWVFVK